MVIQRITEIAPLRPDGTCSKLVIGAAGACDHALHFTNRTQLDCFAQSLNSHVVQNYYAVIIDVLQLLLACSYQLRDLRLLLHDPQLFPRQQILISVYIFDGSSGHQFVFNVTVPCPLQLNRSLLMRVRVLDPIPIPMLQSVGAFNAPVKHIFAPDFLMTGPQSSIT